MNYIVLRHGVLEEWKKRLIQECIPVGCVPSAAVAVSPATSTPLCCACPPTMHAPCHACPLPYMLPPTVHAPLPCMPPPCTPPCRQTDTCENITFPQLLLWMVISLLELLKQRKVRTFKSISIIQTNLLGINLSISIKWHYVTIPDDKDEMWNKEVLFLVIL